MRRISHRLEGEDGRKEEVAPLEERLELPAIRVLASGICALGFRVRAFEAQVSDFRFEVSGLGSGV